MEVGRRVIIGVFFGILIVIFLLIFGRFLGEKLLRIILGWIFG